MSSGVKKWIVHLLAWAFALVLTLITAVIGVLFWVDVDQYRGQIQSFASDLAGRPLTITGPIRLERSLQPTLSVDGLRVSNPAWASRPDLVSAEQIRVQIALLPLLTGSLNIVSITIVGADVELETGPDGAKNWAFGDQESEGPTHIPEIGEFHVIRTVVGYRSDDGSSRQITIADASASTRRGTPLQVTATGSYQGEHFAAELNGGLPEAFGTPGAPWPLEAMLQGRDAAFTLKGQIDHPKRLEGLDFKLSLAGKQLDGISQFLNVGLPKLGPYAISTRWQDHAGGHQFTDLRGRLASSDFSGTVNWKRAEPRPLLTLALESENLDVTELIPRDEDKPQSKPGLPDLDRPIDLPNLSGLDAQLALKVKNLVNPFVQARDVVLTGELSAGKLTLFPLTIMLPAGQVTAGAELDTAAESPALHIQVGADRIDVETFVDRLHTTTDAGIIQGVSLGLRAEGRTLRELLASSNLALSVGQATVSYRPAPDADPVVVQLSSTSVAAVSGEPVHLSAAGDVAGQPIVVDLDAATLPGLLDASSPWPITLSARLGSSVLKAAGTLHDPLTTRKVELEVEASGKNLNTYNLLPAVTMPDLGPYSLKTSLKSSADSISADSLSIQLGKSDLKGNIQWSKQKDRRPLLSGKLRSRSIHVDQLRKAFGSKRARDKATGNNQLPVDKLQDFDADLQLTVSKLVSRQAPLRRVTLPIRLQTGRLKVKRMKARIDNSPVDAKLLVDASKPVPEWSFDIHAKRFDLGKHLTRLADSRVLTGTIDDLRLETRSNGRTVDALRDRLRYRLSAREGGLVYRPEPDKSLPILIASADVSGRHGHAAILSTIGTLRDTPISLSGKAGPLRALLDDTTDFAVDLKAQSGESVASVSGILSRRTGRPAFDLRTAVSGKRLDELDSLLEASLPRIGPYRLAGRLTDIEKGYRLSEFTANLSGSSIQGQISFTNGERRKRLVADLTANPLDLGDLRQATRKRKPAKATQASPPRHRLIPDLKIPDRGPENMDVEFTLDVKRLVADSTTVGNARFKAMLEKRRLALSLMQLRVYDGELESSVKVDSTGRLPQVDFQLSARRFDLDRLLGTLGLMEKGSRANMNGQVDLKGRGKTLRSVLANANGNIDIAEGEGRLKTRYLDLWGGDLSRLLLPTKWRRGEYTELNCTAGLFDLENGVAKSELILLDTRDVTITGELKIDLETERMKGAFQPAPKRLSLLSVDPPVEVSGTLMKPKAKVERRSALLALGKVGAGLINPAVTVGLFADLGTGEANPCLTVLTRVQSDQTEYSEEKAEQWRSRTRDLLETIQNPL